MGISPTSKQAVDKVLQSATQGTNTIPGVVYAAINKEGEFVYEGAAGVRGLSDPNTKMSTDSIVHIASCTKLVTAIACLQLVEQGKVSLDDPNAIETILPEVANAKIISGTKGNFQYQKPKNKITLRMLLDHSSGFSYTFFNPDIRDFVSEKGSDDEFSGLHEPYMQPLIAEPGERWNYSIGLDWAGVLVERISGMKLGDYFRAHIFDPLGLQEIHMGGEKPNLASRLAGMHSRDSEGALTPRDHFPCATSAAFHSGGAGLLSSVHDYLKILNCLLNNGTSSGGVRILKDETVDLMFRNSLSEAVSVQLENTVHTSRPALSNDCVLLPGVKKAWGLSFLVSLDELPSGRKPNAAWWAGIANCYYTIDRAQGVATMIATQILPFADMQVLGLWMSAETELYKGLNA